MAALNRVISIDEFSKTIDHKVVIEAFSALGLLKVPTNFISYLNSKKNIDVVKSEVSSSESRQVTAQRYRKYISNDIIKHTESTVPDTVKNVMVEKIKPNQMIGQVA